MPAEITGKYRRTTRFNLRSEWRILIWCLLAATAMWFLTALNETYTRNISMRVKYLSLPQNKVFVRPLPEELKVTVSAKGWDFMSSLFRTQGEDIVIDLSEYTGRNYILTRRLRTNILQQFSQNVSIGEIFPDTIYLQRTDRMARKVPVKLNLSYTMERHHNLSSAITHTPDSIVISGPESLIRNIQFVETEPVHKENINGDLKFTVKLKQPSSRGIRYSAQQVKVQIPADQLTEKVIELPVQIINVPEGMPVRLIPERISLSYQTTLSRFHQVDESLFQAVVDGSTLDTVQKAPLRVQLVGKAPFTYNHRLKPDIVNFILNP